MDKNEVKKELINRYYTVLHPTDKYLTRGSLDDIFEDTYKEFNASGEVHISETFIVGIWLDCALESHADKKLIWNLINMYGFLQFS